MTIESIRKEIRGVESEIKTLKEKPMTKALLEELHECFARKWELEKKVKLIDRAA